MSRKSLAIVAESARDVAVLNRLANVCGLPKVIQLDNGSGFSSMTLDDWAH